MRTSPNSFPPSGNRNSLAKDYTLKNGIYGMPSGISTGFPAWDEIGLQTGHHDRFVNAFYDLNQIVRAKINTDFTFPSATWEKLITGPISLADAGKCEGAVMAENDCLYGTPHNGTTIIKVNTLTDEYTRFGTFSAAAGKYISGALSSVNRKIYCAPYNGANAVLVIEPGQTSQSSDRYYFFDTSGKVSADNVGNLAGANKWTGTYEGSDGFIYCIPHTATSVMRINPWNDTIQFMDTRGIISGISGILSGTTKWVGGSVWGDYIYGCPYDSTSILKIDCRNVTCTLFGSHVGTNKWSGLRLAGNGKLYSTPYTNTNSLSIDPANGDENHTFGSFSAGAIKWESGSMMIDGYFLQTPMNAATTLRIDPYTETGSNLGSQGASLAYVSSNLARNGARYCMPYSKANILKQIIGPQWTGQIDMNLVLSRYYNCY